MEIVFLDYLLNISLIQAVSLAVLAYFLLLWSKTPSNFPPGPRGFPIVGNFFQLGKKSHETFIKWGEVHGDIIGLRLGHRRAVVLNNYRHIKEALSDPVFSGRPQVSFVKARNRGALRGVTFNEGAGWQEQRRFCLKNLRDMGLGKKSMEGLVMTEVNELMDDLSKCSGQVITTQNRFDIAVINALWSIACGQRYSHNDPQILEIHKLLSQVISKPSLLTILANFFPVLEKLMTGCPGLFPNPTKIFIEKTYGFLQGIIKEHAETIQEGSPRDFIDMYLEEIKKTGKGSSYGSSSFSGDEGEQNLAVVLLDLYGAGSGTMSSTLSWACLLLAVHPEIQEKLHMEIQRVVPESRPVSLSDRPNLPYLEATILEVLRFSSIAPLALHHRTLEDVHFHGYFIPKDTLVLPNLYSAARDRRAWQNPEEFQPARFLSPDGTTIVRNENVIPFSIGKRVCPGEAMARDELHLFMGNLFQRFQWKTVEGEAPPSLDANLLQPGMGGRQTQPHKLVVIDRFLHK